MDIRFVDTTFRDGSQSLWAMGIRHGMMDALAGDLDKVGFDVVEVPANAIFFKKFVRDLKEDPWEVMRMLARRMPNSIKACMGGGPNLNAFGAATPAVLGDLFWQRLIDIGALQRVQMTANTADQAIRQFPSAIPKIRAMGYQIAAALSYSISPRHTDEHYIDRTTAILKHRPDRLYLKDQGGLLTVDAVRTLVPKLLELAGDVPLEIHSHCTTGLAPSVYVEAVQLGVPILHCGIPPLADGSAQPSVLDALNNVRRLGHTADLDEELIRSISTRLHRMAVDNDMPIGVPLRYDYAQYIHQIPGGVISNLRFQLGEAGLADRLDEVVEECVQIRTDLGYPVMITPYSQYIGTQAAINVATGERYKIVIDELIRFAEGAFGEDSGYTWMDPDLRDRWVNSQRARELREATRPPTDELTLAQAKSLFGTPDTPDEEIILRAIMQGTEEIDAMRAAGPPATFDGGASSGMPLLRILQNGTTRSIRYVHVQRGSQSLLLQQRERKENPQ
jgi:oxaloacetate decarboxylase alpha subunit